MLRFGFSPYFWVEILSVLRPQLDDLIQLLHPFLVYSPNILVVDSGGNDLTLPEVDTHALAIALSAFLHYLSYLLFSSKGFYLITIVLEQHHHSCVPQAAVQYHIFNCHLDQWHYLLDQWLVQYSDTYS